MNVLCSQVELLLDVFQQADLPPPEFYTTREERPHGTEFRSILLCSVGAFGTDGTQPNISYADEEAAEAGWEYLRQSENFHYVSVELLRRTN